ncbi:recombinase family protein [soil metagenome]
MRAAIYARFSSDRQNPLSVEDQITSLTRLADQRGWTVVLHFSDIAISGAYIANRPGIQAAITSAERREYDVLLVEDEDRIARNLEQQAHVFNRLRHAGVDVATLGSSQISIMDVALKGLMGEMALGVISAKTKRGMLANAERGLATGSRIYGYRSQPGGAQVIIDDQAQVVREIFDRFGRGETTREIAHALNSRGVPGPTGGQWNPSTLNGSRQRGNGILNTELYIGVKVWNRIEMSKDPATGGRISRPRPESEWKRVPVPALRIVTDEAWAAVQARKQVALGLTPYARRRRKPGLFSGLIRCAECGAGMTAYNSRGALICAARREKGMTACGNFRSVPRAEVEARVLEGLRTRLLAPAAVKAYVQAYHRAWAAKQAASTSQVAPLRRRVAELDRAIDRLVDAICDGTATPKTKQRLVEQEAEKARVEIQLARAEAGAPPPLTLHPKAADLYATRIAALQASLAKHGKIDGEISTELIDSVRGLVDRIEVRAIGHERPAPVMIQLHGTLAAFLKPSAGDQGDLPGLYKVVAGGGLEPPTCGL